MVNSDRMIKFWEQQVNNAENIKKLISHPGWNVLFEHIKDVHEKKILDTFRRIPGSSQYDAGFRILQGEYQMMHTLLRSPQEIIEIGEQAKKNIHKLQTDNN